MRTLSCKSRTCDATGKHRPACTNWPLLPAQYELVTMNDSVPAINEIMSFYVEVDKDAMGAGAENECLEDNNSTTLDGVECGKFN